MPSWLPLFSAPSGFNGGRSQVNLNFGQIGGDYPFLNQMLNFGALALADTAGSPAPNDLDANGYPLNGSNAITVHGGIQCLGFIPAAYNAGTTYTAQVTGKGTIFGTGTVLTTATQASPITISSITGSTSTTLITFSGAHLFTIGMEVPIAGVTGTIAGTLNGNSFVITATATNTITITTAGANTLTGSGGTATYGSKTVGVATGGRVIMDCSAAPVVGGYLQYTMYITATDAVTPITKVALVRLGSEETRYNAGEIFGIDFLNKLNSANFGVIRFLNNLNTNISNVFNWADRTPQTYITYAGTNFKNSIYAGTATASGVDYSGTLSGGTLTHGQQVTTAFPAGVATISNGANAVISRTSHGLSIGDAFNWFTDHGGVAPTGTTFGSTYYVIAASFTANSFEFSSSFGGAAITTSSAGSGTFYIAKTEVDVSVTFHNGSTTIDWPGPLPAVNDPVSFTTPGAGTALSTPFLTNGFIYYVKTSGAGSITVAATVGGTAIAATSAPSGTPAGVRCPTYNLNTLGAKPILSMFALPVSVAGNTRPLARFNGDSLTYGTLTYDAVLNCWLLNGAQAGFSTQAISAYWPPEVCFALCNHPLIRAHPWFPSPALVLDPISDYMPSLATYIRGVQPSWMIPRYEVHNELWNSLFYGTDIGLAHATVYKAAGTWSVDGIDEYCGKVGSVLGQAVKTAYGSSVIGGSGGASYQLIIGVHTGLYTDATAAATTDSRLSANQYVLQAVAPQSPYTKSAACDWSTHVTCAQYIAPADRDQPVETTLATAFNGMRFTASIAGTTMSVSSMEFGAVLVSGMTVFGNGIITPVTISGTAPNWTLSSSANGTLASRPLYAGDFSTNPPQTYIESFSGAASGTNLAANSIVYGVVSVWSRQPKFNNTSGATLKMCGYEGGYSPDYATNTNGLSQIDMLRFAGKLVTSTATYAAGMQTVTTTNYTNFTSNTLAEFPSCFQFTGQTPTNNVWSVLEEIYQAPLPPQWNAIVLFNH